MMRLDVTVFLRAEKEAEPHGEPLPNLRRGVWSQLASLCWSERACANGPQHGS